MKWPSIQDWLAPAPAYKNSEESEESEAGIKSSHLSAGHQTVPSVAVSRLGGGLECILDAAGSCSGVSSTRAARRLSQRRIGEAIDGNSRS